MRERYGYEYVCQGGSFTTFGSKGGLKDLARLSDINFKDVNYVSGSFSEPHTKMVDVFKDAKVNSEHDKPSLLRNFIDENPEIFDDMSLIIGQPKSASTTASAVVIVPKEDGEGNKMTIFDWLPVRNDKEGNLTTEWQKGELEDTGFLKEDILSLGQLDKFQTINDLMVKNGKEIIDFEQIQEKGKIDDKRVFELFHKGYNQDVFQFGTNGLTEYSLEVKPDNFSELVDMIALYRPGPMESHAHYDYVKIKHGEKEPEYDFGVKSVTKPTKGLIVFQEQIMKICQELGGFSLSESDNIRKSMGKKQLDKIEPYKEKFIESAVKKGCEEYEANMIWNKLIVFAGYGFVKAHAVAYTVMSYKCQYHKYHNPVEYWTSSLQHCKDKDNDLLSNKIVEIFQLDEHIKLITPDINESKREFVPDFKNSIIYWSLGKIPFLGDIGIDYILKEREENGKYFSLEEFRERVPGKKATTRGIENLILSGAFDGVYKIKEPKGRLDLIKELYILAKKDLKEDYLIQQDNVFWILKQREFTGLGYLDFEKILEEKCSIENYKKIYKTPEQLQYEGNADKTVIASGVLVDIVVKKTKTNKYYAKLIIDNNSRLIEMFAWGEIWNPMKKELKEAKGKIIVVKAKLKPTDKFKKTQTLSSMREGTIIEIL